MNIFISKKRTWGFLQRNPTALLLIAKKGFFLKVNLPWTVMSQAEMCLGKNGFKFNKAVLMLSLSDFTFNIKQKIGEGKQENLKKKVKVLMRFMKTARVTQRSLYTKRKNRIETCNIYFIKGTSNIPLSHQSWHAVSFYSTVSISKLPHIVKHHSQMLILYC